MSTGANAAEGGRTGGRLGDVSPTALVLGAVTSVQVGGAIAKTLFDDLGSAGTVLVRLLFAAVVLMVAWRPRVRVRSAAELRLAVLFGLSLAGMNLCFYLALDRLPLGVAVTFEFVGPLSVAVAGSRRALDFVWVVLAGAGIVLLAGQVGGDPVGIALALGSGAFWAAYIVISGRVGASFPGGSGLALAMVVATALILPVGVADAGAALLSPELLLAGAAVAMLSSAIPYSLELEALRRMPQRVFGVLMSLEPAVAAMAGFVVLGERLAVREVVAVGLVVVASIGASRGAAAPPNST